jgi:hypothetical protein
VGGPGGGPAAPAQPNPVRPSQQQPNTVIPVAGPVVEQTTRWTRHYWGANPFEDPGYGTNAPILCGGGARAYEDTLTVIATGEVLNRLTGCETPGTTTPSGPGGQPAPPPPPPRPEEVWSIVPVPLPTFGINPGINGLTGLKSYLWDPRGSASLTATATIRGYTTTATAVPSRWVWRMWQEGDTPNVNPSPLVTATVAGSRDAPAATYMYETNGDYKLTLAVTWSGTYTFTGPGAAAPQTVDLGTTSRSSTRPYHVIEIRGARVG